jgi:hypothetical protein
MTQRQLDLSRPTYEANIIPLGISHIAEIRKKGTTLGIYKVSPVTQKKRGLSLPINVWTSLQNQAPIINLNLQFASGTVGVEVVEGSYPSEQYFTRQQNVIQANDDRPCYNTINCS